MAWLSRVNFTSADVLSFTDLNNVGNDIRSWGGNVNGGGYVLSNVVLSAFDLSTCFGLPISTGVSGLGTGVATFLGTPSSANLAAAVTNETGTGALVFATSPTLVTPTVTTSLTVNGSGNQLNLNATSGAAGMSLQAVGVNKWQVYNDGSNQFGIYDYTAAATRLLIGTTGNVGIATTSPAQMLQVGSTTNRGQVQVISNDSQGLIVQTGGGSGGSGAAISFYDADTSYAAKISTSKSTTNSASLVFSTANGSAAFGERMRIDPSGSVGIGTASPGRRLHVEDSSNTVAKIKTTTTGSFGALQIFNSTANAEASIGFRDDSDSDATSWVIGKSVNATDAFGFYYGGAKMTLDTAGNVGIGTASPAQKLTVASGSVKVSKGYSYLFDDANVEIRVDDSPAWLAVANTMTLKTYSGAFVFQNSNGAASIMTVRADTSNVGIGTTSPATSAKLDIGGTTGALLVPRLTTTERNALTAVNGMIIYNTTDNQMQGRINGAWAAM